MTVKRKKESCSLLTHLDTICCPCFFLKLKQHAKRKTRLKSLSQNVSGETMIWKYPVKHKRNKYVKRSLEQTTNPNNTHTRSKTETDEALSESTQNQGRLFQLIRILQWKINASDKQNCHQPQLLTIQNHIRGVKVLNTNTLMHQANSVSDKL